MSQRLGELQLPDEHCIYMLFVRKFDRIGSGEQHVEQGEHAARMQVKTHRRALRRPRSVPSLERLCGDLPRNTRHTTSGAAANRARITRA